MVPGHGEAFRLRQRGLGPAAPGMPLARRLDHAAALRWIWPGRLENWLRNLRISDMATKTTLPDGQNSSSIGPTARVTYPMMMIIIIVPRTDVY